MINSKSAVALVAAGSMTAAQLVFTGVCLAVGFAVGNMLIQKVCKSCKTSSTGPEAHVADDLSAAEVL